MQLDNTWALLLLLAIPALCMLYLRYARGRKDTVLKFSSLYVIVKADAKRGFARRHLPFVLLSIVVALLALAMADLQLPMIQAETAGTNGRSIGIVLDGSESMAATDYDPSRLDAAKQSIARLIAGSDPRDYVGVVLFETGATTVSYLTHDKQRSADAVMSINRTAGATAIGDGLALGIDMVLSIPERTGVVILLSDGVHNSGRVAPLEAAAYAQQAGVPVHTIGIGSEAPVFVGTDVFGDPRYAELDEETLMIIANMTGGAYSKSVDSRMLEEVFAGIEVEISYRTEYQSLRDWFIAASTVLVVAAAYVMYGRYRIAA